jgi:hypothetical protein
MELIRAHVASSFRGVKRVNRSNRLAFAIRAFDINRAAAARRAGDMRMREGGLFATMFGLGAGAVLVGVTVSRLVVGQLSERPVGEPPVLAAEVPVPAVVEAVAAEAAAAAAGAPPRPAVLEPPPAAIVAPVPAPPAVVTVPAEPPAVVSSPPPRASVSPPAEPPVEVAPPRQARKVVRKHRRPPVEDEAPLATASIPTEEAEPAALSAGVHHAPIAIVRGGVAWPRPGAHAPGPHIIQVGPSGR